MTCSNSMKEMMGRRMRVEFIEYEARRAGSIAQCRWPEGSPERTYWLVCFGQKESPPVDEAGGRSIPHQRDADGEDHINSDHSGTQSGVK